MGQIKGQPCSEILLYWQTGTPGSLLLSQGEPSAAEMPPTAALEWEASGYIVVQPPPSLVWIKCKFLILNSKHFSE